MNTADRTIETVGHLSCSAQDAWAKVCFYEHIETQPSWFLRTVLPVPMRTTGCYGKVGDSSRCLYSDGGYLAKRITHIVEGERIDFDITEHSIRYCRSIALKGGTICIVPHDDGSSSVHMKTRYQIHSTSMSVLRFFIGKTISAMHRIVMKDMEEQLGLRSRQSRYRTRQLPPACRRVCTRCSPPRWRQAAGAVGRRGIKPANAAERSPGEVRVREIRIREVCVDQLGIAQICIAQIGA